MIEHFVAQVKAHVKAKLARTVQSTACLIAAAVAGLIALIFFLAALFVWLAGRFGAFDTCLMFGGGFVVLALIAAVALMILRRRPQPSLNVAALPWNDPTLLMGFQAAKGFGGRRAGAAGLIGAFIVGLILSRSIGRK